MPAGLEVTAPVPVPSRMTERVGRFATVRVALPARSPEVAVIVVEPEPRAEAKPAVSIVATVSLLLAQVTPSRTTVTGVKAQRSARSGAQAPHAGPSEPVVPLPSRP